MATESKVEHASIEDAKVRTQGTINETEVANSIRSLQEESQQISELVEMERSYATEVSVQLKQIIMPLNASYHIKPESISKSDSSISDVVLTPQGLVCVFYNSGNVVSRPLESITSEVLIRILGEVIPDARALMNEKRQKLSGRVMMLEKLSKEMRKVPTSSGRPKQQLNNTNGTEQSQPTIHNTKSSSQDAMRSAFG